jgi:4,5-DOPA dioxygenase extradiol
LFLRISSRVCSAPTTSPLSNYESLGRDALLSIPTADHYLPLLSVLGTRVGGERLGFPVKGVDGGSISMLAAQIG